ncbi:DUF924 family protein [Kangiella sp. TOML190]|uniref:DUF924 family protein n=1 Tax=Kangiella sp. TOML190 TaxID=2931351 RepID=UPI00203CF7F3|nr:DUF924 family protein [Kangiella sp. TOML190]
MNWQSIIDFWFQQIPPKQWWLKDSSFDDLLREKFAKLHAQAIQVELSEWRAQPLGRLAEIIVLDQFSRNIYRDTPQAFAADPLALALSQMAIASGDDQKLKPVERQFLYMPFMHSESRLIHQQAEKLYQQIPENGYDFELKHKVIIDRFGRYPHRNNILGRESTKEELDFLKQPDSSF